MAASSPNKVRKISPDYVWLLLAGSLALGVLAFSNVVISEDAYISFRYAYNLVEGHGLVFNEGEYVEGYTSLLWTLLMALPELFNIPVHLFAAYAGLAFGLLALVEAWRTLGVLGVLGWPRGLAIVTLGAYPKFWLSTTKGLEGGLFAFLLVLAVRLLLSGKPGWAGVAGGLLFAVRPESLLLLGVFGLYALTQKAGFVRLAASWMGLAAAATLWRLYYYEAWIPNSITAKAPPEYDLPRILTNSSYGIGYLGDFAFFAAPLTLGALAALFLAPRNPAVWLCLGAFAVEVPVVLANGGDWMPHHRLVSVYAPVLAVLLGIAVSRIAGLGQLSTRIVVGLLLLAGGVLGGLFMPFSHGWDPTPDANVAHPYRCYSGLASTVQPTLLSTDRIAAEAIGIFGYTLRDNYVHDVLGLTDYYSAHYGYKYAMGFGKSYPEHTYHDIQPTLIITHTGLPYLSTLAAVSNEAYNEEYSTYRLTEVPACDKEGRGEYEMMVSIQKESVSRILPGFASLAPERVEVPYEPVAG